MQIETGDVFRELESMVGHVLFDNLRQVFLQVLDSIGDGTVGDGKVDGWIVERKLNRDVFGDVS